MAAAEARRLVHTAAGLAQHGQDGVLEAIERAAQASAAAIGLAAVAGIVDWAGQHTPARADCPQAQASATRGARLVARRTKTVRTLLGSIEVTRGYYHCATHKHGFAPLDARPGITGTSLSPGLARACALAGAEMPYDKSRQFIATVTGLDLASTSTLARTTRAQGHRARDLIAAARAGAGPGPVTAANTQGPDLCYIVVDGTGAGDAAQRMRWPGRQGRGQGRDP